MCGICGLANWGDAETLMRMTQVQAHRGPDDSGVWQKLLPDGGYCGLGSRRLAILDLSAAGHMPMSNGDGTVWIALNGEIYNFAELREELTAKGHRFHSQTDTEVVVHLYEQEGVSFLRRLRGMFALAIYDLREAIHGSEPLLLLARDHFGIKPLYYTQQGGRLAFASEVKSLLEVPGVTAQMDREALQQFLTFLWVPDPLTMFRDIWKLPAGHYATFCRGELKIEQYWDLQFPPSHHTYSCHTSSRTQDDLVAEVRERFRNSVREQMISDVPLGAFLSAGLDSSSIVAMMAEVAEQPVRTYTITFPAKYRVGESTLDDPDVAGRVAAHFGCRHHRIEVDPNVAELLPKLIWHMDEPVADPAAITAYLVCKEATKDATVLLSGVGGDELFAGYRKHVAQRWAGVYQQIPGFARRVLEPAILALPGMRGTALKGPVRLAKKMARSGSLPPQEQFIQNATYLDAAQKRELYEPAMMAQVEGFDPAIQHRERFSRVNGADFLNQMLYLDTKIFMTSLNLTYNDKMSMASSVEVRVPFLDHELAQFVASEVPPSLKLKGLLSPETKHILRRAMKDALPEEVLRQPKAGFFAPVDYWLAHEMRPMVDDLLSEARIRARGLLRPDVVRRYVEEHRSGRQDWSMQIWQFLTLELWMQMFLDNGAGGWRERNNAAIAAATRTCASSIVPAEVPA